MNEQATEVEKSESGGGLFPSTKKTPKTKKEKIEKAIETGKDKKPKRIRRSQAEIKAQKIQDEQRLLSDANFEIFQQIFKMMSDMDAERYGISRCDEKDFESISKSYATICNYYLPGGKPIYFVIASATIQTMAMLKGRNEKIKASLKGKEINDNPNDTNSDSGKIGIGEVAPGETPITKL